MAVRTALLNGNNINLDSDFSKYLESLTSQGVISGFDMTTTSVGVGKAFVKCTRTNGETIMVYVENKESISISGNGYIVIKVPQAMIDDGTNNPVDGTGIATIELVQTLPSANYMTLGQIVDGILADVRYFIPKVQNIDTLNTRMTTAEADIEALEEAGVPDHLGQSAIVGEKYTLSYELFKQLTPTLANSTVEAKVGDVAADTEIHIQRIASGTASNQLKLKVKMAGSPTTSLKVEVRKGIKVDVSSTEAYWYGNSSNIIATGTLAYSSFTTSWKEVTFNLDNEFGGTEGELLDIVVYQTAGSGAVVNASNYYIIGCDSTQWSEAFSYVCVNGTTRTRQKLMPYCVSAGFSQAMLSKTLKEVNDHNIPENGKTKTSWTGTSDVNGKGTIFFYLQYSAGGYGNLTVNDKNYGSITRYSGDTGKRENVSLKVGDILKITWTGYDSLVSMSVKISYKENPKNKLGKIYDLKGIGEKTEIILFGILPDGTRRDGN